MRYHKFIVLFTLSILSGCAIVNAQNLDEIFDDKNLSDFKFIVETGYDPILGNFILTGEYRLAKNFSSEVELLFANSSTLNKRFKDKPISYLNDNTNGFGVGLDLNFYWREVNEGIYSFLSGHFVNFDKKPFYKYSFGGGYQRSIYQKLVFDVSVAFGLLIYKREKTFINAFENDTKLLTPVTLKIGYILF